MAVIDCTGHGIPGALLTMRTQSLLDAIIQNNDTPNEVLSVLHAKWRTYLGNSENRNSTLDGCDIGIYSINYERSILTYSGANIDLGIFRDECLIRNRATPAGIGGVEFESQFSSERSFEQLEIKLCKGDIIIMSTDGIIEQLDRDGKYFDWKGLEIVCREINKVNPIDAQAALNKELRNLMDNVEQQDDTLLFGFIYDNNLEI